ncbi:oocyte zinc finger protein XlCOF22-like [Hippocampus zosterae]|uniref:oocyte zinc finger protein XlCOF22-like n=1 Tax=Hippocampus zosterae TaxID=109293 RepID=UPI00223CEC9B|nr:oocyte zinc finger protein XlCOF22-like [Hippocampus zosterae]
MCQVEMLRALLSQRLSAAVEEIFGVFERTIAEYEEELSRTKEENERQRQLLDTVFKKAQDELHREDAGTREGVDGIKELEPLHVKEEVEEGDITKLSVSQITLKSENNEDKGQSELHKQDETLSSSSSQAMQTKGDGDHCKGSQVESLLAPLSHCDDMMSHSPYTDDEHSKCDLVCHNDNKHVKCSQCDKQFYDKSNLNRHMRVHTGEKPFTCIICGKCFNLKDSLVRHTRIHTGEKPFSCSVCGKRFSIKGTLNIHARTHTGEKPYHCSVCNASFSCHSGLGQHMRRHTRRKAFVTSPPSTSMMKEAGP